MLHIRRLFIPILFLAVLSTGCDSQDSNGGDDVLADSTLRTLADLNDMYVGAAVASRPLDQEPRYRSTLSREFNMMTAENDMKFGPLRPSISTFDFSEADELVDFAESADMAVRGHTLIWHQQLPFWVTNAAWTRTDLLDVMRDHITGVMEHYEGRIAAWDVVNEAVADGGGLRSTIWLDAIGEEYIGIAFQVARDVDADATLFYNDYNVADLGAKSQRMYDLVEGLVDGGVPIDGVGFQMHITAESPPDLRDVADNMQRYDDLGLEVHITELDVRVREPISEVRLIQQAAVYRDVMEVCLEAPNCTALVTWGFTDRYSWIPGQFDGFGAALPFDGEYEPKPAYESLQEALLRAAGL